MRIEVNAYELLKLIYTRAEEIEFCFKNGEKGEAVRVAKNLSDIADAFYIHLRQKFSQEARK